MKTLLGILLAIIIIAGAVLLYERHDADTGTSTATSTQGAMTTGGSTPSPTGTSADTTDNSSSGGTAGTGTISTADIQITSPQKGQTVSSPLTLTGKARGNWFFEASAPVYLKDANGKTIAQGNITATGDWMTTNFVPFTGTLMWTASSSSTSTAASVVFMNDNPSGNPALQKTVTVPVVLSR